MSGNSADMGENRTEKAKPIQSMAKQTVMAFELAVPVGRLQ